MKLVKTAEAKGCILGHDMTEIVPGVSKLTRFRKGCVVSAEDIPVLLNMGKEFLYVLDSTDDKVNVPGMFHEEEGAEKLSLLCRGENIRAAPVREGKIELFAERPGLLKVDAEKQAALNRIEGFAVITLRGNTGVREGDKIAALKIIPLFIREDQLKAAVEICGGEKPINVIPYRQKKAGLIVTGNEIASKRVNDTGSEILKKKMKAFPVEITDTVIVPDETEKIKSKIFEMAEKGMDLIICTGGMSVDPDDKTPVAIRETGARIVSYGVPFAPGVMMLISYYENKGLSVPVIGAPACVFYEHTTAFDILLPRFMADDPVCKEDLVMLGHGGLCG